MVQFRITSKLDGTFPRVPMHNVDGETTRPYRRICFGEAPCLLERTDLIQAESAPAFVRLVTEWTSDLEVPDVPHRRQVTEMLALEEFGGPFVNERGIWGAAK